MAVMLRTEVQLQDSNSAGRVGNQFSSPGSPPFNPPFFSISVTTCLWLNPTGSHSARQLAVHGGQPLRAQGGEGWSVAWESK